MNTYISANIKQINKSKRPGYFSFRSLFLLAFLLSFFGVRSQDILDNPGFEKYKYCPVSFNQASLNTISVWRQVARGTPDYFHSCSKRVGVPNNMFGYQKAREGEGYVGMAVFSATKTNYREYLQIKLERPMVEGDMYCFEIFISPADYDLYVCDGFGAYFSEKRPIGDASNVIKVRPQFYNPQLHMLDETEQWTMISDVFVAEGGEEYLTIGNFRPDNHMKILKRTAEEGARSSNEWAYVYVDDIRLKPVASRDECSCVNDLIKENVTDPPMELSEVREISFQAVLFDFDENYLTEKAKSDLNKVVRTMLKSSSIYMEIIGHTDIIGGDGYNVELSEARAKEVIRYMVSKGIDESRLKMRYYGSQMPAADNTTAEGRAQNRRVEFQILQKKFELYEKD